MSRNTNIVWPVLIIGILAIAISVKAQAPSGRCQLLMCAKDDTSVAVSDIATATDITPAQEFISSQCPLVTHVISCYIDCNGPYNAYVTMSYWTWKKCTINPVTNGIWEFICDPSVLNICNLGKDPQYPFN